MGLQQCLVIIIAILVFSSDINSNFRIALIQRQKLYSAHSHLVLKQGPKSNTQVTKKQQLNIIIYSKGGTACTVHAEAFSRSPMPFSLQILTVGIKIIINERFRFKLGTILHNLCMVHKFCICAYQTPP